MLRHPDAGSDGSLTPSAMRAHWLRFHHQGAIRIGTLEGPDRVRLCEGDMFADPQPTDTVLPLAQLQLAMPVQPTKVIALWNNFGALAAKLQLAPPAEPLYLLKSPNAWLAPGGTIRQPRSGGKVVFEGELGIVIGKTCSEIGESQAASHVFGYTCANDVTVADILHRDPSFPQWARAKGFDTFCPFGPVVATGLDARELVVKTYLNGELRQDYPVSDMRFTVEQLVSRLSHDMTLFAGDIILCGTSVGVGSMQPGSLVEVEIAGIGRLGNRFESFSGNPGERA